jgi:hypothetical protein
MRKAALLFAAAVALLLPVAAQAKGASQATIEGPGLGKRLTIAGNGESAGNRLGDLGQYAGFFPAVFGQSPDPMRARPVGKDLGPRYRIVWDVPGPNGMSKIRQDVYPFAQPTALSFMKSGQTFWDGQKTHGGWYVGGPDLRRTLVAAGLPSSAPGGGGVDWNRWLLAALAISALATAVVVLTRRTRWLRPEPAG